MDEETRSEFAALRQEIRQLLTDFGRENAAAHADTRAYVRRELESGLAENRRHMGVLIEGVEHKIAALVEGFTFMNEKVDRNKADCDAKAEALDVRVTRLEATNARHRR